MNNIVLCGFMGCGKSTVGKNIARKTGRRFLDMDRYIEDKAGMTVSEIFEKFGEEKFRDMEHNACLELSQLEGLVIASGGGAFTYERNVSAFKGKDKIVFLDVPLAVIKVRLKNDKTRPLLQRPDKDDAMKSLYTKRYPVYKSAADITVKGKNTPLKTAMAVIAAAKRNPSASAFQSQKSRTPRKPYSNGGKRTENGAARIKSGGKKRQNRQNGKKA